MIEADGNIRNVEAFFDKRGTQIFHILNLDTKMAVIHKLDLFQFRGIPSLFSDRSILIENLQKSGLSNIEVPAERTPITAFHHELHRQPQYIAVKSDHFLDSIRIKTKVG